VGYMYSRSRSINIKLYKKTKTDNNMNTKAFTNNP
jgi:hypothetical protein